VSNVLSDQRVNELCEYILADLERTLTITELESVFGVSARSLQYAFRRRFNCTPGQWIVEQKLLAVHSRLLKAKLGESVTQIAIKFFGNLGDFSRKYRHRFGELPSQTLARLRG
jgi:transcriptional regulator GlxA family with amidase domain